MVSLWPVGGEAPGRWISAVVGSTRDRLVDGLFVGSAMATWAKGSIGLFRTPSVLSLFWTFQDSLEVGRYGDMSV